MDGHATRESNLFCAAGGFHDVGMCLHACMMHYAHQVGKCLMHIPARYAKCMLSPSERLKLARERAGYETAKDAAEAMGIPVPTYSQHENGRRGFPAGRAPQYARKFKVSEQWLLFGKGDPDSVDAPLAGIPIIGEIPGGNWRQAVKQSRNSVPSPDPSIPAGAFALRVTGDSMDKYVDEGGIIIIDPEDRALLSGKFYAVMNGEGETTFKQFKADPARLVPCSTNPAHRDIMIGEGHMEVIGRIIWRAARM